MLPSTSTQRINGTDAVVDDLRSKYGEFQLYQAATITTADPSNKWTSRESRVCSVPYRRGSAASSYGKI